MPVYDAVILWSDSRKVLVGTEFGLYSTNDITASNPVWNDENADGLDYVAVYHLRQQTHRNGWIHPLNQDSGVRNHGYIYAGTHGRGIFVCKNFSGPTEVVQPEMIVNTDKVSVFPNPAGDYTNLNITLENNSNVQISIFDMQGKLVDVINYNNLPAGRNSEKYNCSALNAGVYLVRMKSGDKVSTTKLIVK